MGQLIACLKESILEGRPWRLVSPHSLESSKSADSAEDGQAEGARGAASEPGEPSRRILLISDGSQGDVQPLVPLAKRLARLGHEVAIATNADHVAFLQERGVPALATFPSKRHVFDKIGCSMRFFTNPARTEAAVREWSRANPCVCISLEAALRQIEPELMVCTHQVHGPAGRYALSKGAVAVVIWLLPSHVRRYIDGFDTFAGWTPPWPTLLATSPVLDDAEPHISQLPGVVQTGVWVDEPSPPDSHGGGAGADDGARKALEEFLAAGPPPVAIGWGSMVLERCSAEQLLLIALRVAKISDRRAVILGGWARLHEIAQKLMDGEDLAEFRPYVRNLEVLDQLATLARERCCFVESANHLWLFPRCSCVVHHGGSGTTQAVVRCGCPSVITPVWIDQFWWAKTITRLEIGVGFTEALEHLPSPGKSIADAVLRAEAMAPEAQRLGKLFRAEDGVGRAVEELQRLLREADAASA